MRIGLIARADATGLGIQTFEFYRHMQPSKTLVVDLSHCSGRPMDLSMYPDAVVLEHTPYPDTISLGRQVQAESKLVIDEFLEDLDIVFSCETVYDYYLVRAAKEKGVKTVLQYNFELLDYVLDPGLPMVDLLMAPSKWRYDDVTFSNKIFLPVPVNTYKFPERIYESPVINHWFHPGGNPAMEDRNGTMFLAQNWKGVSGKSRVATAKLTITTPNRGFGSRSELVHVQKGLVKDHADLYAPEYEGFIMPRKFGGLCLPLNEAMSLGMPVVMTDLEPQNEFLLRPTLISTDYSKQVMTKMMIDIHEPRGDNLIEIVNRLSEDEQMVADMRERSRIVTEKISWKNLKPLYEKQFGELILERPTVQLFEWGM